MKISIHAPLAGSDPDCPVLLCNLQNFNPRSPCGERRVNIFTTAAGAEFQSTLPLRGATIKRH